MAEMAEGGIGGDGGDRIQLRGLRVLGTHGVLPEEKGRAQPFEVDLDLTVDLAAAVGSDRLADTVDYARVAHTTVEIVAGGPSYELLEALAGAIARAALASDDRIAAVSVGLRKLQPPLAVDIATVGVQITRRR
ncbi:MAG: dihydroneopterin aldolase [Acidimicrobiales bacterium]|nr:dihydroneopterin aldolase [Acidimicrobiales bacterium]